MSAPLTVFVIAGEPSGDRLGAALMRALRQETDGAVAFSGVGGEAMAAEGLESLFPIADIAVMGIAEVLPRLRTLTARLKATEAALLAAQPDALVTIDAPSFGLRVAGRARARLPQTAQIHYVAPSVWAWRPKRAERMARAGVDHVMALLPFEPPYFEAVGLSCDFVGHPVIEATAAIDPTDRSMRADIGVDPDAPLVVALPGSRQGEVRRLTQPFGEALGLLAARRPGLAVVIPTTATVADAVKAQVAHWPVPATVLDPRGLPFAEAEQRKFRAMAAADVGLAASGTVSVELAAIGTPMAIGYRTSAITAAIVRRLVKVDSATLTNLVTETRAVPEFLQESCRPEALAAVLDDLMTDGPRRRAQLAACAEATRRLGGEDAPPSVRAARSVLAAVDRRRAAA